MRSFQSLLFLITGHAITSASQRYEIAEHKVNSYTVITTLLIHKVQFDDAGLYRCQAGDQETTIRFNGTLKTFTVSWVFIDCCRELQCFIRLCRRRPSPRFLRWNEWKQRRFTIRHRRFLQPRTFLLSACRRNCQSKTSFTRTTLLQRGHFRRGVRRFTYPTLVSFGCHHFSFWQSTLVALGTWLKRKTCTYIQGCVVCHLFPIPCS